MIRIAGLVLPENRSSERYWQTHVTQHLHEALLNGLRLQDHLQFSAHSMPLCCLVVVLVSEMKSVQVAEMSLVIRHLLPTHDQMLLQGE